MNVAGLYRFGWCDREISYKSRARKHGSQRVAEHFTNMVWTATNVVNLGHVLTTTLVIALSVAFVTKVPDDITFSDISAADPKYGNFLAHIVFASKLPDTVSLQTIAAYSTHASPVDNDVYYGMSQDYPYENLTKFASIFLNLAVQMKLKDPKFTGTADAIDVGFASPLWTYHHNLHLFDNHTCNVADITANLISMTAVNSSSDMGSEASTCIFADPTAVNFQRCYYDMFRHRVIGILHLSSILLLMVFYFFFLFKQSLIPVDEYNQAVDAYVILCERCVMMSTVVILALFSLEIISGIPAVADKQGECPDNQTGLKSMYDILVSLYAFLWILLMQLLAKSRLIDLVDKIEQNCLVPMCGGNNNRH